MSTDPKRVKEIFLEAAELPDEAARTAFLDRACGGDARLRARVEALLRSHDPAGSFLGTPAAAVPDRDHAATQAGRRDLSRRRRTDYVPGAGRPAPTRSAGSGTTRCFRSSAGARFGIVFRAFDDMLHRVVAVKVLSPQMAATSPARKRFLREARSSAQVRHENVVQVYAVGEQPLPYIAMEFIPGETLQQRLDRTGPLDVSEVLRIGRQIAEGLAAAHATDLIHRDIKPGNMLLEGGSAQGEDHRLRPGPRRRRRQHLAERHHRRHADVHGPRAGQGRDVRPAGRPVQPGQRALRRWCPAGRRSGPTARWRC